MKIAVAQIEPTKGNILENSIKHIYWIERASQREVDFILFPELSLTGYEPKLAEDLAIASHDKLFNNFQKISDAKNISIGLGVPTRDHSHVYISMLIFQPTESTKLYLKQYLHLDEEPYFSSGKEHIYFDVKDKKIAPAICYESLLPEHSAHAFQHRANIYAASVAKPQSGLNKAMEHYPKIAKQYKMVVIMANSIGHCDNFLSVGKSAIWNDEGELVGQLKKDKEGLLIYDIGSGEINVEELD